MEPKIKNYEEKWVNLETGEEIDLKEIQDKALENAIVMLEQQATDLEIQSVNINSAISVEKQLEQKKMIIDIIRQQFKPNIHFMLIDGTDKPALLAPGADLIFLALGVVAEPTYERTIDNSDKDDQFIMVETKLKAIKDGVVIMHDIGSCNSMEHNIRSKYWDAEKNCNKPNKNVWSEYHVITRMSLKRARVALAAALSGIRDTFSVDMEEFRDSLASSTKQKAIYGRLYQFLPLVEKKLKPFFSNDDKRRAFMKSHILREITSRASAKKSQWSNVEIDSINAELDKLEIDQKLFLALFEEVFNKFKEVANVSSDK